MTTGGGGGGGGGGRGRGGLVKHSVAYLSLSHVHTLTHTGMHVHAHAHTHLWASSFLWRGPLFGGEDGGQVEVCRRGREQRTDSVGSLSTGRGHNLPLGATAYR